MISFSSWAADWLRLGGCGAGFLFSFRSSNTCWAVFDEILQCFPAGFSSSNLRSNWPRSSWDRRHPRREIARGGNLEFGDPAARLYELFCEPGTQFQLQPLRRLPPHLPAAFLPPVIKSVPVVVATEKNRAAQMADNNGAFLISLLLDPILFLKKNSC
jgi:hypothetical protein